MQSAYALQQGLTQAQKYKLACFISQHLVIIQRSYVPNLKGLDFPGTELNMVKSIFDTSNIFEVCADLDGFLFLAQIAQNNNLEMLQIADPERGTRGVRELADMLISQWNNELRMQRC